MVEMTQVCKWFIRTSTFDHWLDLKTDTQVYLQRYGEHSHVTRPKHAGIVMRNLEVSEMSYSVLTERRAYTALFGLLNPDLKWPEGIITACLFEIPTAALILLLRLPS